MSTDTTPPNVYQLVLQQVQARRDSGAKIFAEQIARIQAKQVLSSDDSR